MKKMAIAVATLICAAFSSLAPAAPAAITPPNGFVRFAVGVKSARLTVKRKKQSSWILGCLDNWCPSACCWEGGCISRATSCFLDNLCCCIPSIDGFSNCDPDCLRRSGAAGLKASAGAQVKVSDKGETSMAPYGYSFVGGFLGDALDQPLQGSGDEETCVAHQENIVAYIEVAAAAMVAAGDQWSVYLIASLAGNPFSNGSKYRIFQGILGKRKDNKPYEVSTAFALFGPEFRWSFNADVAMFVGVSVGIARSSSYINQSEAAEKFLSAKSPQLYGAFELSLVLEVAATDDLGVFAKGGLRMINAGSAKSFTGNYANRINAMPGTQSFFSVGLSLAV